MTAGQISLSFADGWLGDYTIAYPILAAAGQPGTVFEPVSREGHATALSTAQMLALQAAGWDICSHGVRSGHCDEMPLSEILRCLNDSRQWLISHGFPNGARTFGPPGHRWNASLNPLAAQAGYVIVMDPKAPMLPAGWPWPDIVYADCGLGTNLSTIHKEVDRALAKSRRWLFLGFHNIVETPERPQDADATRVQAVVDYLASKQALAVTPTSLLDR